MKEIGLSEVRRPGEKLIETKEHHLLYHKGKETYKQNGVGFLVHKTIKSKVKEFYEVSERVVSLTLQLSRKHILKIIQVYAPTTTSTDEELEMFYEDVTQVFDHQRAQETSVMGDLNAKVGEGDELLERLSSANHNTLLMGDLNFPMNDLDHPDTKNLSSVIECANCSQPP